MRRRRSLLPLVLLLGGCAWFGQGHPEPTALPFPDAPALHFARGEGDTICLSTADANRLARWMDQLRAFQAARQRLLAP